MRTTTGLRRGWRLVLVVAVLSGLVTGLASTAYAGLIAERSASIAVSSGKWSATGPGSSAVTLLRDATNFSGIFTVSNNGSLPLSGFTLAFSGSSGVTSQFTVSACRNGTWAEDKKAHVCSGTEAPLGTASGGLASVSVTVAPGSSVSLRVVATKDSKANAGSTKVSVRVSKSNAVSKR